MRNIPVPYPLAADEVRKKGAREEPRDGYEGDGARAFTKDLFWPPRRHIEASSFIVISLCEALNRTESRLLMVVDRSRLHADLPLGYGTAMQQSSRALSSQGFVGFIGLVVVGLLAFPLYQALITEGFIFYTTGTDESSHLSFFYSREVASSFGRMRYSSHLVHLLHTAGLSGGYINLLLDVTCSITTIALAKRAFVKFGYDDSTARCAALLGFILPLLFTPFNPAVSFLASLHFEPAIMKWFAMPYNTEIPFIRSPEPQLSWLILSAVVSTFAKSRALPWALLAVSPLLYTFVQVPIVFVAASLLLHRRLSLWIALLTSFALCVFSTLAYVSITGPTKLSNLFIYSHLPLISYSGLCGMLLLLYVRRRVAESTYSVATILVASVWAAQNTQVLTGTLVTPVNFENYWGVAVLGYLATLAIIYGATQLRAWVYCVMALFIIFSVTVFEYNRAIFERLPLTRDTFTTLATSSSRVAVDDLYLASYLDLVHPQQPPTTFSWTRTYELASNRSYDAYLCAREEIGRSGFSSSPQFIRLFEALDFGFQSRGADMFMSLGRQPIPLFPKIEIRDIPSCPPQELIVVATK